jgi:hypothetical protein
MPMLSVGLFVTFFLLRRFASLFSRSASGFSWQKQRFVDICAFANVLMILQRWHGIGLCSRIIADSKSDLP